RKVKQYLGMLAFSFKKLNWEKWLMVHFKINKLPNVHIVDRYLDTLSAFDIKNDKKGLDYFIPDNDKVSLVELPIGFQNNYVGFVIGAQHSTKKMPIEKIAEICAKLKLPVILLGGTEDKDTANEIISKSKLVSGFEKKLIFNSCGKFSINQSASLVRQAQLIISHDTGLMHIAAAFKKKIISLWGNTIPEFGMYPYFPAEASKIFQVDNLKCRPCTKIGFSKCYKKHFDCMNKQDIDGIVRFANQQIS
ncbi:MAG: glycosyltransferase family 9 protein, partial [Bacteroidota bacterium]|nr:glycosyltransferase family 9 protein [Bacteroidota bacterium]